MGDLGFLRILAPYCLYWKDMLKVWYSIIMFYKLVEFFVVVRLPSARLVLGSILDKTLSVHYLYWFYPVVRPVLKTSSNLLHRVVKYWTFYHVWLIEQVVIFLIWSVDLYMYHVYQCANVKSNYYSHRNLGFCFRSHLILSVSRGCVLLSLSAKCWNLHT